VVDGLEPERLRRIVDALGAYEPETTAVLVRGSYAKGTADAASDLDLTAITPLPRVRYRMWFDDDLHVSADAKTADEWVARGAAPATWSFGLAAREDASYVRTDDGTRAALGDPPSVERPWGDPELEDFVEYVVKVAHADATGARLYAHRAAELAPRLLAPLNNVAVVVDRRHAVEVASSFAVAPRGWREDFTEALGVAGDDAPAAAVRLARSLLPFLREHAPDVDPQPDVGRYLRDGTLERALG
jgi:hypothetical protein